MAKKRAAANKPAEEQEAKKAKEEKQEAQKKAEEKLGAEEIEVEELEVGPREEEKKVDEPKAENAFVRVIHSSPGAPNINVLIDDVEAISDLGYIHTTEYMGAKPGTRMITVNLTDGSTIFGPAETDLENEMYYTMVVTGLASGEPPLGLVIYEDKLAETSA
ncbi:MAG: DUF4397 domain-containing protein [Actinobacteria bacterium]|nr:DUF4397 domain-containing protein [Actinomycetota bacterium]